jgi:hypothetical protein
MEDWAGWLVLAVVAVVGWAGWRLLNRSLAVVEIDQGTVRVISGQPPRGAVDEISAIAKLSPKAKGRVTFGRNYDFETTGLDDGDRQRLRNAMAFLNRRR